jgi:hypothetical protein
MEISKVRIGDDVVMVLSGFNFYMTIYKVENGVIFVKEINGPNHGNFDSTSISESLIIAKSTNISQQNREKVEIWKTLK